MALAHRTGRSRLPVHSGDLDQVLGVLTVKDLLFLHASDPSRAPDAGRLARPAMVVPESRPIEDLLLDMREQRQHVAIVIDEYGSVSGLVTMEDVLEELIGDFDDETDRVSRRLRRRPDGRLVVPGSLRPHELAEKTGVVLPDGPYETVAGFVQHRLGEVPEVGASVEWRDLRLTVSAMDGYRVAEVTIRPL